MNERPEPPEAHLPRPLRRPYAGETYYGRPALKPAAWGWLVSGYIAVSGLSGGSQLLAALFQRADRQRSRGIVRNARFIGLAGSAVGAGLLIADLRTPQRFYNMMRIFRPTSPMSIGTYVLLSFSGATGVTVLGEVMRGPGRVGRIADAAADMAQVPAAIAGAGLGTYTAALLSATSTPYWAAGPAHLGAHFASSSIATSAAALSIGERLGGRHDTADRLDTVAAIATGAHLAVSVVSDWHHDMEEVGDVTRETSSGRERQLADLVIGGAVPLAAYATYRLTRKRSPGLAILGAAAIIAGGFLSRHATMRAGERSAERPRDYFRFAQGRHLPERHRQDRPVLDRPRRVR